MQVVIIVNNPEDWAFDIADVEVVRAKDYVTKHEFSERRGLRVYNLCRSYRYQALGYYVSLLAEARGHKAIPDIGTIQDIKSQTVIRLAGNDLDELIQKTLAPLKSERFTLSIYFGRNLAKRYERLSAWLYNSFEAPFLRAEFVRHEKWQLQNVEPIAASEIPDHHKDFVTQQVSEHFQGRRTTRRRKRYRYDLAILHNPDEQEPPSDSKALQRFVRAAEELAFSAEMITREDYGRIAEFDALFIRETTNVNHHTYRFARRAEAEGLVVIDDPLSILRCTNKVFLAELLERHKVATPRTTILHKDNLKKMADTLELPCILKQPDSSFSQGVIKVEDRASLRVEAERLLQRSALLIAQEFLPTSFDWRIGIFEGRPLYACKYHMASKHWQIIARDTAGNPRYGRYDTIPVEIAPSFIVRAATKAANLIGNGLYGVDVKEVNGSAYIIEVNDNPNIDAGVEDALLKDELYRRIMEGFLRRVEQRKAGAAR